MKKILITLCLFATFATAAHAQFERGKVVLNTSLTGLNLSYSDSEKGHFGLNAMGGYFILDNFALTGTVGMDLADQVNKYHFGVGGRYYMATNGLYFGGMVQDTSYSYKDADSDNDFSLVGEAGYAFFLSRTVTIEPAVYYNLSLSNGDYSTIGLKVGFSFYF
jgi:hypothetical protein